MSARFARVLVDEAGDYLTVEADEDAIVISIFEDDTSTAARIHMTEVHRLQDTLTAALEAASAPA